MSGCGSTLSAQRSNTGINFHPCLHGLGCVSLHVKCVKLNARRCVIKISQHNEKCCLARIKMDRTNESCCADMLKFYSILFNSLSRWILKLHFLSHCPAKIRIPHFICRNETDNNNRNSSRQKQQITTYRLLIFHDASHQIESSSSNDMVSEKLRMDLY